MNNCKTCKKEIDKMGKTGKPKIFCSDKCKQFYTNHIKSDKKIKEMRVCAEICVRYPELCREWVELYAVDGKGAFRRKVFEDLYGVATGISGVTKIILELIDSHPGNELLTSESERFNAWRNNSTPSLCPTCELNWPNFNQTVWRKFCSEECCNAAKRNGGSIRDSIDSIMIEKYGIKGGFTKERIKSFDDERQERTGFRNITQNPITKIKLLESMSRSGRFVSKAEKEIKEYFETVHHLNIINSCSSIVKGRQIDLFFPEHNLAVEYNGCFFHSEGNGGREFAKFRHIEKTEQCEAKGVQLVHIWEDEWRSNKQKVLRMLESKLGLVKPVAYARNCSVVHNPDTVKLYNGYHIQGHARSTVAYGLEYEGSLVAAMGFLKTEKEGVYELNRFASAGVHGAFSKLLKVFFSENIWKEVYSFGDRCVVSRLKNVYTINGFKEISVSKPDYKYTSGKCDRIHKFNFRKGVLLRKFPELDPSWTESQMSEELGFKRIYGCGLIRYSIKNQ